MVVIPRYECSRCGTGDLPLDHMKLASRRLTLNGRHWASWCMECHRENGRERARRKRQDPDGRRRLNEATYRYRRRRRADPAAHARDLETARIAARLRREKRGEPLEGVRRTPPRLDTPADSLPVVPSAPLWAAIERYLEARDMPESEFAAIAGLPERRLYEWRHGANARYDAADKALMVLDLHPWDVWDDEVVARLTAVR